jgi:hypothetical protein
MQYRIQNTIFPNCMTLEVQCEADEEWETVCEIREAGPGVWTAHRDTVKSVPNETLEGFCEMLARRVVKHNRAIVPPESHQIQLL